MTHINLFWWKNNLNILNVKDLARSIKRVFYYKIKYNFTNFGDELSPIIISKLTGKKIRYSQEEGKMLALGSILHFAQKKDVIWGTGLLKENFIPKYRDIIIHAVRGPKTRKVLINNGFDCPEIYGDPAILLPKIIQSDRIKKYDVGILPHWSMIKNIKLTKNQKDNKILLINVTDDLFNVINKILECEIILSASLHGLIISDAFSIPRLPIYFTKPPDDSWFKFEDYSESINVDFTPYKLEADMKSISKLTKETKTNIIPEINKDILLKSFPFELDIS